MENILSTAAEEAGTDKYFFASMASSGKVFSYVFQKSSVHGNFLSETSLEYSFMILSASSTLNETNT